MSEPHIVIPYVVISSTEVDDATGAYALEFRTNFQGIDKEPDAGVVGSVGSEPANLYDEDSKCLALGRIVAALLAHTGASRLDIEFIP